MTEIYGLFWIIPLAAVIALVFAYIFFKMMMKSPEGTPRMKEIAQYVREGAMAYIKRQYKVVALVFAVLLVLLAVLAIIGVQNPFVPIAFLTGGFFSALCGYLGMKNKIKPGEPVAGELESDEYHIPTTLDEALTSFEGADQLRTVLREEFCMIYSEVKREEVRHFHREISPWEREHLLLNV